MYRLDKLFLEALGKISDKEHPVKLAFFFGNEEDKTLFLRRVRRHLYNDDKSIKNTSLTYKEFPYTSGLGNKVNYFQIKSGRSRIEFGLLECNKDAVMNWPGIQLQGIYFCFPENIGQYEQNFLKTRLRPWEPDKIEYITEDDIYNVR